MYLPYIDVILKEYKQTMLFRSMLRVLVRSENWKEDRMIIIPAYNYVT